MTIEKAAKVHKGLKSESPEPKEQTNREKAIREAARFAIKLHKMALEDLARY